MQIKRSIKLSIAAGALVAGMATPALATTIGVGGGTWDYGVSSSTVRSNYFHQTRCHGSSVEGQYYDSSGNVAANDWARASANAASFGNQAWWRNTC
ncbi:lactococcin 972 family bacteriocin [Streptomyces aurantiacus]|uniref:Lactococcin 972 family bacteriocin n=1 Tax=Streptomyces aurantiacus TaxID=47760 RepID=A0A7G1NRX4_9ACTN|nr:lactococcin 972 family bacteriocin [Streptomyces aurantiacus]BCL25262.1 hypothetical protein GCM10017557_01210 [Streptomyces aurantiacus]